MEVPHVVVSKFSEEHYDAFISNLHETTQKKYRNNIKDYKMFCTGKGIDFKNECNILTFVTFLRKGDSENGQEERLFAASTLWSMASTVSTYFMYAIGGKPLVKGSRLTNTLNAWSKQDTTRRLLRSSLRLTWPPMKSNLLVCVSTAVAEEWLTSIPYERRVKARREKILCLGVGRR
jgi:hypothetical protein